MVKFAHVSDTHLGKRNFKLKEREDDFDRAFSEFVDKCIEEKVDFVIHSGDLFDIPKPRINIIVNVIKELKRLKQNNIPVYIIAGSHDMGIDGTLITALENVELLENIGANRHYEHKDDKIILHGRIHKDFFIAGVPGRRANIEEIFSRITPEKTNAKWKIFMFHHSITDVSPSFGEIPTSLLPKGFDYYAGGHWHFKSEMEYNKKPLIYPGPTEYCDSSEMEREGERGFYIIEEKNSVLVPRFVKLNTRNVVFVHIDCGGLSPQEIVEKCTKEIKDDNKNSILIVKLSGRLREGKRVDIDRNEIYDFASEKNYLYAKINMSDLMDPFDKTGVDITGKNIEEIEHEFLKQKGYSDSLIIFAKELVSVLGRDGETAEAELNTQEIIKKLEEDYIETEENKA
ncbi:MAG: DNA repair exonuclease [Candidatus Nanoarchaeia archaeon]|nr:DNA repair exonuclease [Candidatus Nanoarchaeia archaeon]